MGKKLKKSLAVMLCLIMMVASVPAGGFVGIDVSSWFEIDASAVDAAVVVDSGTCGDDLTWTLDEDGVLTISGSGDMTDWTSTSPWGYNTEIKSVKIESGVTSIGDRAFAGCTSLATVDLADSITSIGSYAFLNCSSLTSVELPAELVTIKNSAFKSCTILTTVEAGDKLVSIGSKAFAHCYKLTGIDLPETLTTIGSHAFYRCFAITSFVIPNNVTSIGTKTFYYCSNLTSVVIGDSVTKIGDYAFNRCESLTYVKIPDSVTSIGIVAFSFCLNLTSIIIPDSVTSIGANAFNNCKSLISVSIGSGVTTIETSTFSYCSNLEYIKMTDSITTIYDDSFYIYAWASNNSYDIKTVIFDGSQESWDSINIGTSNYGLISANIICNDSEFVSSGTCGDDISYVISDGVLTLTGSGDMYDYTETTAPWADIASFTEVVVGEGITSIGDYAFYDCINVESVTLASTIKTIGEYSFGYCLSLNSITIPDATTSIDYRSFAYCLGLESVDLGSGVKSLGTSAFWKCTSLESIVIPESVTTVYSRVFYGCCNLTTVEIKAQLSKITDYMFGKCVSLTTINIPATVQSIGNYSFYKCTSLESLTLSDATTKILYRAFYYCTSLKSVDSGDNLESIGDYAFYYCKSLQSIDLGNELESIGNNVFSYCSSLESITLPNSVTSLGYAVFYYCSNLKNVTLSESLTSLQRNTFYHCSSLESLIIPDSITSVSYYVFYYCSSLKTIELGSQVVLHNDAMNYCYALENIEVSEDSENYCSIDGVLFSKDQTQIIKYPNNKSDTSYTIPDYVISINDNAFMKCDNLISVTLGSSVKTIGSSAFYSCSNLENITMGNSVETVNSYAFAYCYSLKSIEFPDSVTSILNSVLSNCHSLESVTLSESITSILSYTFYQCTSLKSIVIPSSVTNIQYGAFYYCSELESITLPNTITSLGNCVFERCTSLKSVVLSSSLTSIPTDTFYYCTSLESIIIPDSVQSIGTYAFYNCSSLETVTLPVTTTNIYSYAFWNCTSLDTVYYAGSESQFNSIYISSYNAYLSAADINCADTSTTGDEVVYETSGVCGENLTYEIVDGVLTISGEGDMTDWESSSPWSGNKNITSIVIEDGVTSIGDRAFYNCSKLETVQLADSITSIGSYAFLNCYHIETLTLPTELTVIKNSAFENCVYIETITMSSNVTTIGKKAFYGTSSDKTVYYTGSYSQYCGISQSSSYLYATVYYLNIPLTGSCGDNATYSFNVVTGVLTISGTGAVTETFSFDRYITEIVIEDGITEIGERVFWECENLVSVDFGNTVETIGYMAFDSCTSLTNVELPESLTDLAIAAFSRSGLVSISIPSSVTTINYVTFWCCTDLETVYLTVGLEKIDIAAFSVCPNLSTIYFEGSLTQWAEIEINYESNGEMYPANDFSDVTFVYYNYEHDCDYTSSITTAATCGTIGEKTYTCSICGDEYKTTIAATGNHNYTSTITTAATCVSKGVKTYTCSVCGDTYKEDIAATGSHTYGSWVTTTAATPVATGIQTATCTGCGVTKNQTIAKLTVGSVSNITVENGSTWLQISWSAATNATGYQIFVDDVKVATLYDGETTYKISNLSGATDYDIQIRSFSKVGGTTFGSYSSTYTFTTNPFKASFSSYSCTETAIRVNWNAVAGADGYRIYQLIDGKWVSLATVSASTLTYRVSGLESGEEYSFKVKAYTRDTDGVAQFGVASNEYIAKTKSTQVQMTTYTNTTSAIRINWEAVDDADGYRVYQYVNGSWKSIATIQSGSTTTYRISGLSSGTIYKFKVKAFIRNSSGTAVWQEASDTFTTMTDLATAKITSSSKTSTAVRINWNEVDGATGYKVYMLVNGTWKVIDTIYDGDITTYRIDGLSSGTTYQFKIKAFSKSVSPVVWGGTSSIYKVTTK